MSELMFDSIDSSSGAPNLVGRLELRDGALHVQMGEPPYFSMQLPLERVVNAERVPDLTNPTRGAHGRRGRWLVNTSGRHLVRLALSPSVAAQLRPPKVDGVPRLLRPLLRERTLKISELTLSMKDPDALLGVLPSSA